MGLLPQKYHRQGIIFVTKHEAWYRNHTICTYFQYRGYWVHVYSVLLIPLLFPFHYCSRNWYCCNKELNMKFRNIDFFFLLPKINEMYFLQIQQFGNMCLENCLNLDIIEWKENKHYITVQFFHAILLR